MLKNTKHNEIERIGNGKIQKYTMLLNSKYQNYLVFSFILVQIKIIPNIFWLSVVCCFLLI